jgi:heme exporter protein C
MRSRILGIASLAGIAAALYFALVYAPTEQTMGTLQRVFYFHLPQAILSYLAAFLVGFGSLMYLATRDLKWDRFAYCNAELGVLFTATTLI